MSNKLSLFLRRINPYLASIIVLGLFLVFPSWSALWYLIVPAAVVIIFISLGHLLKWKLLSHEFFVWLIANCLIVLSCYGFIVFLEVIWVSHLISILVSLLFLLLIKSIYSYLYSPDKYQTRTLENIIGYINLIIVFFGFATAFNILVFLSWPIWPFLALALAAVFVVTLVGFWFNKVPFKKSWFFAVVFSVILTQAFWVFTYLSTSHLVNALVVGALYYLLVNSAMSHLNSTLNKKQLFKYIIISLIVILAVLVTAKWT